MDKFLQDAELTLLSVADRGKIKEKEWAEATITNAIQAVHTNAFCFLLLTVINIWLHSTP